MDARSVFMAGTRGKLVENSFSYAGHGGASKLAEVASLSAN